MDTLAPLKTLSHIEPSPTQPTSVQPPDEFSFLLNMDPAEIDNSKIPITPIEQLHITAQAPVVNIADYRLNVDGLVEKPLALTYWALLAYPTVTSVVLLICPGYFVDNAQWTGVPVSILLNEAGIKPEATQVTFYALDGYNVTVPLEDVQEEAFLAHTVNGEILPTEHGYPLRLVIKGEYGGKWVKWVMGIEVM